MQETERQLIDAIQGGDREALRRLYDRFSRYAMAITRRYVVEREDALDVVQDSFVNILSCISSFDYRGEGSLKAWVSRIVTNEAIDWVKSHEGIVLTNEMPDETDENVPDVEEAPPEIMSGLIRQLPVGCRTVLNLHIFGELTHKDIAHKLGISEKTSASQFAYAKKLLADMIKEYLNSQRK